MLVVLCKSPSVLEGVGKPHIISTELFDNKKLLSHILLFVEDRLQQHQDQLISAFKNYFFGWHYE